jgi:hypothetical protein
MSSRNFPAHFILVLILLGGLPARADLAWIDLDDPAGTTAPFHTSLAAAEGASVTAGGVVFTVFGGVGGSRDRGLPDAMLSDFVFKDGAGIAVGLRLAGLPAGTWTVESWHFDGGGFAGAIQVEFRPLGGAGAILVDNFAFATTPAVYDITSDGVTTYELVFREDDANNRARLNGLRIRRSGTASYPPLAYVDAGEANTAAAGGSPAPFWTDTPETGARWTRRPGFGFDVNGNREIFQKDATSADIGDAALLETTVTGLVAGREYGVHVCFLSVPGEAWRVRAGLAAGELVEFRPDAPSGRITDLGLSSEPNSNRRQYLGFIGNASAGPDGRMVVQIDDGEGTGSSSRTWYEGVAVGGPVVVPEPPPLPGGAVEVAPDGAWTWFNDERAIFHGGRLFTGYVLADGRYGITRYDPAEGSASHVVISTVASRERDDHNNPSLTVLPDGRLLAVYSKHGTESAFYWRISKNSDPATLADWNDEQRQTTPARNTYANTYRLAGEGDKIYNFHRCITFNPTLSLSTDNAASWGPAAHFIATGTGGTRPYPRYCSNHQDRIDLIYTDGHPRDVNNSVYHLHYRDGAFRGSDGGVKKSLAALPLQHDAGERGTVIYAYSAAAWGPGQGPDDWIPGGRAWTWDIHYGKDGRPLCAFQVQRDNVTGSGWNHDRIYYYYARWTGSGWQKRFIAQAGRGLYQSEDDYGGGMAIDPEDPRVVYISTNAADPFNLADLDNVPLAPAERYEIWRGFTADGGLTFSWTPVTSGSAADNLRPIVPENHGRTRHLLWFHGSYSTYTTFATRVLGIFDEPKETLAAWQEYHNLTGPPTDDSDGDGLADLLEYALDGSPRDPGDQPRPALANNRFTFNRPSRRTDVEWLVEGSGDLVGWDTLAVARAAGLPHEVAEGGALEFAAGPPETVSLVPPPDDDGRGFLRLRVRRLP